MQKQNIKHYIIMDDGEDLSIKNTINPIASIQRRFCLDLSELIEITQKDHNIWEFSESIQEGIDKKDTDKYSM